MPDMRFAPPNPLRIADRASGLNAVSVRSYNERLVLSLLLHALAERNHAASRSGASRRGLRSTTCSSSCRHPCTVSRSLSIDPTSSSSFPRYPPPFVLGRLLRRTVRMLFDLGLQNLLVVGKHVVAPSSSATSTATFASMC